MQRNLIIAAAIAGLAAASAAPAATSQSGAGLSVRNDSAETLNCRVTRQGRSMFETVVLRAGRTWSIANTSDRPWTMYCDPPAAAVRYRLTPGTAYRLVPDSESVQVVLRTQ